MVRLFVSAPGQLRERWGLAFPDARVVSRIAELGVLDRTGLEVCGWISVRYLPNRAWRQSLQHVRLAGQSSLWWACRTKRRLSPCSRRECRVTAMSRRFCEQLREIALVVEHGGLWMPPDLMQRFLAVSTRVIPTAAPETFQLNDLTSRELMVAEQVAHGSSNREIAEALEITERTVKAHLSAIFEKLGVRDRVQLALRMNNIPIYSTVN